MFRILSGLAVFMNYFYTFLRKALIPLSLVMILLSFPEFVHAQKKKPQILEVGGKVRLDEGRFDHATIEVRNTDNNKIEKKIEVESSGKFDFQLPYQHNYQLFFKRDGFYPKMLILTTVIPEKVIARDPYFPPVQFVVTLFKVVPEIDPAFSKKPVGKIFYSAKVDNFDSESYFNDMQIRQKIDDEKTKLADKSYQKKLDQAKALEEAGKLSEAIAIYQQAADLKPKDDFVKDKIKLLGQQIKLKEDQAKLNEEFKQLMADGDNKVNNKAYRDAIDTYNKALKIKPDNPDAKAKINQVDSLIAAQEAAAKQRALAEARQKQFDDAVAKGDKLYGEQSYADATDAFNEALKLQPDAQHPKEMLNKIQEALAAQKKAEEEAARQKAMAEARQKQFEQTVSKGDSLFAIQSYADATTAFNQALQLQPDAKHPQKMLEKIKEAVAEQKKAAEEAAQLKALAEARQKQYDAAVSKGDSLFAQQSYADATAAFNQALQLQPNAKHPQEMLGKIQDALNALADQKKAKEEAARQKALAEAAKKQAKAEANQRKFSAAVAKGDSLFGLKQYDGSIAAFNEALQLQPDAQYPATMLEKIKKALAEQKELQQQRALAEKKQAEKDKQYNDLIAKADQQAKDNQLMAAKQSYTDAGKMKPQETYPIRRVNEINALLAEQARKEKAAKEKALAEQVKKQKHSTYQEEKDTLDFHYTGVVEDLYLKNIKKADAAFAESKWTVARFFYFEAQKYKPQKKYPRTQVDACDKAIEAELQAEREKQYQGFISKADASLKTGEFTLAKFYYQKGLKVKSGEEYPKKQLVAVEKAVQQKHASEDEAQFRSFVKKADDAFNQKDLSVARFYYQKALALKPDESYPKTQLDKLRNM
ncbi:hypothetical protein [Prolixibacter denitrificans]|uniref:Tetratricopeptide repeat protein n=2 Tax=Prolixibacter denitrificans TaxID=1541063 RepID=A0A2P8CAD3_9BACT|nr:hypothetical protein [Prolixibacter denitrificans]PSK81921.1 tetratricopeptide repeat protein [Prolixibacter denitrificans]